MPPFSFVHAADLHLDSPFQGIAKLPEGDRLRSILQEATFQAFDNVIDLCLEREVDFLLIAGDVYDGADRNLRPQLRFRDGLKRLTEAGISTWVIHGNHDPLDGWTDSIEMPGLVHVFGDQLSSECFVKNGIAVARVHGVSYPSKRVGKRFGRGFERTGNEPFQIGLLHCNVGAPPDDPYVPRTVEELAASELDYWALGHIHETSRILDSGPFIGYPGNIQGRHRGESGARGVFYVEVGEDGHLLGEPEVVGCDAVRWSQADVDISHLASVDQLLGRIEEKLDSVSQQAGGRPVVAKLRLYGRGTLHKTLARSMRQEDLDTQIREMCQDRDPLVWIEAIELATQPNVDIEARRKAEDFVGDLLKLVEASRHSAEIQSDLQSSLDELYEHRLAKRYLAPPSRDELLLLLNEAEGRCLDLLQTEDSDAHH